MRSQSQSAAGERSQGSSITAFYENLDTAYALEARHRISHESESDRLNQIALKERGKLKPERVIKIAQFREEKNPAEEEIIKLRKEGLEVPRELLDKKLKLNKERHE